MFILFFYSNVAPEWPFTLFFHYQIYQLNRTMSNNKMTGVLLYDDI